MKIKRQASIKCSKVTRLLSQYQDNEYDNETREKIKAHLPACDSCREEFELLEQVTAGVRALPMVETGPYFAPAVMGKLSEKEKKRGFMLRLPAAAYTFVFILFLFLGLLFNSLNITRVTNGTSGDPDPYEPGIYITRLLTESQDLRLMAVQDSAVDLLTAASNNGEYNEK